MINTNRHLPCASIILRWRYELNARHSCNVTSKRAFTHTRFVSNNGQDARKKVSFYAKHKRIAHKYTVFPSCFFHFFKIKFDSQEISTAEWERIRERDTSYSCIWAVADETSRFFFLVTICKWYDSHAQLWVVSRTVTTWTNVVEINHQQRKYSENGEQTIFTSQSNP